MNDVLSSFDFIGGLPATIFNLPGVADRDLSGIEISDQMINL